MTKQVTTYDKTTYQIIEYKEFYNGKLITHQTFNLNGETICNYRQSEHGVFWHEYIYENGKLVSFWNSIGDYMEYNEKGMLKSRGTIQLKCNLNDKARNNIR